MVKGREERHVREQGRGKGRKKREVRNGLSRNHALSYIITIRVRTAMVGSGIRNHQSRLAENGAKINIFCFSRSSPLNRSRNCTYVPYLYRLAKVKKKSSFRYLSIVQYTLITKACWAHRPWMLQNMSNGTNHVSSKFMINNYDRYVRSLRTIFERKTAALRIATRRDSAFKEVLPTFWLRPVTWLHSVQEIAFLVFWSTQHCWWGLISIGQKMSCTAGDFEWHLGLFFLNVWFVDCSCTV